MLSSVRFAAIAIAAASLPIFGVGAAHAQTTLSPTLADQEGTALAHATWTAFLEGSTTNGGFPVPNAYAGGSADSNGVTTMTLVPVDRLDGPATWAFTICPNASVLTCSKVSVPVSSTMTSSSLGAALSAGTTATRFYAGPSAFGYSDGEVLTPISKGSTYFNVVTGTLRQFDGQRWSGTSGGGSGTVTSVAGVSPVNGDVPLRASNIGAVPADGSTPIALAQIPSGIPASKVNGLIPTVIGYVQLSAGKANVTNLPIGTSGCSINDINFGALQPGQTISGTTLTITGNGNDWVFYSCSAGGSISGVPAGSSVQIPATLVSGLAPSATTDATNASNIVKGQLAPAQMPARSNATVLYQSHPYTSTSYANEFNTVGTAPPLDAFGRLQPNSTAGSETGMQSVIKTFTTNSENWIFDVTLTVVNAPANNTYGIVLATKSVNPNAAQGMRLNYSLSTGQAGGPLMSLASWTGSASGSTPASSPITSSPGANGKVRLILARRGSTMYGIAQNLATGVVNTLNWTDALADAAGSSILPNAGQFALVDYGGTYTINNITITEDSADNPNICILGDSKSDGVGSQGMRARFASLLDAYGPVDVFAGGGDGTAQVLASLPTVLAKGCRTVILAAPFYNDLGWGTISVSQSQANYSAIVSTLKAAGDTVKHMYSIPSTGSGAPSSSSIGSYNSWLSSTFSGDTIIDPSVGFNVSTMLTSTGIHPNDAGHFQVATDIIAQGGLTATSNNADYQVPSPLSLFGQP